MHYYSKKKDSLFGNVILDNNYIRTIAKTSLPSVVI